MNKLNIANENRVVSFFQGNIKLVLYSIAIIAAVFFSYNFWQKRQNEYINASSYIYSQMLLAINNADAKATHKAAQALIKEYKNTVYAQIAALQLAKEAVEVDELDLATVRLQWVVSQKNPITKSIAATRLARVLVINGETEAALNLIDKEYDKNYVFLFEEARAMAFLAQDNKDAAREALLLAYKQMPEENVLTEQKNKAPWLELQMRDVGAFVDKSENT